jgi:cytochrome bd-type quinol oxidase subunit 2
MKALRRTVAIKDKVRAGLRAGNIALAIAIFSFILVMLSLFPIIQPQMQNNQLTVNNSTQQSQQQTVELGGWIFIQFAIFLIIFNMLLGLAVYFDKITIDGYLEGKDLEILLKEGEY